MRKTGFEAKSVMSEGQDYFEFTVKVAKTPVKTIGA
jgi:hypothetical protein